MTIFYSLLILININDYSLNVFGGLMPAIIKKDRSVDNMNKCVNQSISINKDLRKVIIEVAEKNKRNISSEILYRVEQSLVNEGLLRA